MQPCTVGSEQGGQIAAGCSNWPGHFMWFVDSLCNDGPGLGCLGLVTSNCVSVADPVKCHSHIPQTDLI